jgi:probable phosphoglycerate mutase
MSIERRLYLVRHGLPDYRDGQPADEPAGPPLSGIGRVQVGQVCRVLANRSIERIHTSPLARARDTANLIARRLHSPLVIDLDLKEWHRTEDLCKVSMRSERWLKNWLVASERCAAVVGHASPLLALLRAALRLPHRGWYRPEISERFEMSMASVFELTITPSHARAECLFHPTPRIMQVGPDGVMLRYERPVVYENKCVERSVRRALR